MNMNTPLGLSSTPDHPTSPRPPNGPWQDARPARPRVVVLQPERRPYPLAYLEGFRVEVSPSAPAAIAACLTEPADLLLADASGEPLDADGLVRAVRHERRLAETPLLLLVSDEALRPELLRAGAQECLASPVSREELLGCARQLVSRKRAVELLQRELGSEERDLFLLAQEVARERAELHLALGLAAEARRRAEDGCAGKTSFLALTAHELRTPLTALQLQLARLERLLAPSKDAGARQCLQRALATSGRLADLLEGLLQFARLESGRLSLDAARFDLADLVSEAADEVRGHAEQKQLRLEVSCPRPLGLVSDRRLVRLVVMNLLVNAVKFTEAGFVRVAARATDGGVHLEVSDSGPGIPEEARRRVFEPFEQIDPASGRAHQGVGLGLAIVARLVQALHGRVELTSRVGGGSRFVVGLPRELPAQLGEEGLDAQGLGG